MAEKSVRTAVVAIPPESIWESIQKIRRAHDKQVRRWMPHITLIYPFVLPRFLDGAHAPIAEVCARHAAIPVRMKTFDFFRHSPRNATIWLDPDPRAPFIQLQAELQQQFPHYNDVYLHSKGFIPHLSVGQAEEPKVLVAQLQANWTPLDFTQSEIALIRRDGDNPFEVVKRFPLSFVD